MSEVIHYEDVVGYTFAHGRGKDVLLLAPLDYKRKRIDGKWAYYILEYRWLSEECKHVNDQAWACVQGSDYILLTKKEGDDAIKKVYKSFTLFDLFNRF